MTYEEAIKILHPDTTFMALSEIEYYGGFNGEEAKIKAVEEACVIACEALKKQMPKKPINDWSESPFSDDKGCLFLHTMCPNCKKVEVNKMDSFCFNCGQAIDWGESE